MFWTRTSPAGRACQGGELAAGQLAHQADVPVEVVHALDGAQIPEAERAPGRLAPSWDPRDPHRAALARSAARAGWADSWSPDSRRWQERPNGPDPHAINTTPHISINRVFLNDGL
jgi:hypothetical protein